MTVSLSLTNDRSEIARLARFVDEFGAEHHLPSEVVFHLNLALDEVVTNVIRHGYDDGAPHPIVVTMMREPDGVTVRVEDEGLAFDPLSVPPVDIDARIEDRPIGGLGMHLVRSIMDRLEYRREGTRNVFVMQKSV